MSTGADTGTGNSNPVRCKSAGFEKWIGPKVGGLAENPVSFKNHTGYKPVRLEGGKRNVRQNEV